MENQLLTADEVTDILRLPLSTLGSGLTLISEKNGMEMMFVRDGSFLMGRCDEDYYEKPEP